MENHIYDAVKLSWWPAIQMTEVYRQPFETITIKNLTHEKLQSRPENTNSNCNG